LKSVVLTSFPIGWNAPRNSLLLVHPDGTGSEVDNEGIGISFAPTPDYSGIAKAAAGHKAWAGCAGSVKELDELLPQAIDSVKNGVLAVLEVRLKGSWSPGEVAQVKPNL
jgi:hypothetical protein